jgi:hypothetical protein
MPVRLIGRWRSAAATIRHTSCTRRASTSVTAYPRFDEFVAAKRRYDPQLRFWQRNVG